MSDIARRLRVIGMVRRRFADDAERIAGLVARPGMSTADVMVAEILPLLAAARFLERRAERLLADRRIAGRPAWLWGTRLVVRRVPLGRVLVIGPGNYPLFLPGVQALQAYAAGNHVRIKPAPGWAAPMLALRGAMLDAGALTQAIDVLDDTPQAAQAAIAEGVDHVVLTGSSQTGQAVLTELAPHLVPATMELSGDDPFIVLEGAELDLAAKAAAYAMQLNQGETCIAPRRFIAMTSVATEFRSKLVAILGPDDTPEVVAVARPSEAVAVANGVAHALGAVVFGPEYQARRVGEALRSGCVVVNDAIVPTADPMLPFGGAGDSGFGVTRGAEGLLAMTRHQAIVVRHRPTARHLTRLSDSTVPNVGSLLRFWYGSRPSDELPRLRTMLRSFSRDLSEIR